MAMIERMAIAMADDYGWDWSDLPATCHPGVPEDSKEMFLDMARAALAAMRDPTDNMCRLPMIGRDAYASEIWTAMIDAALTEPQP